MVALGGSSRAPLGPAARGLPVCALLSLCALLCCAGPRLDPVETEPAAELQLPRGARCGPMRAMSAPAVLESAEPEPAQRCDGAEPAPLEGDGYSPLRPLGVGYPNTRGVNLMPPRVAYLTFDDGPSEWTNTFLDILKDKGVRATFFVTAKQLKGEAGLDATYQEENGRTVVYRDVLQRELEEGHQIANHTVNHIDLAHVTRAQITSEIEENELLVNRALVRAGGKPELLTLFRPPYGSPWFTGIAGMPGPQASERITSHGLNIMWTVTSGDAQEWAIGEAYSRTQMPRVEEGAPTFEEKKERVRRAVVEALPTRTGDGMIVLMHDTHSATREVLPDIIENLADQGYAFETIEHYVQWRWGRPSLDMAPGPAMYDRCVPERDWGCEALGSAPLGIDRATEVCGRLWVAYHALGGAAELGAPLAAPERAAATGVVFQEFERARIELHPELPPPCNQIAIPR